MGAGQNSVVCLPRRWIVGCIRWLSIAGHGSCERQLSISIILLTVLSSADGSLERYVFLDDEYKDLALRNTAHSLENRRNSISWDHLPDLFSSSQTVNIKNQEQPTVKLMTVEVLCPRITFPATRMRTCEVFFQVLPASFSLSRFCVSQFARTTILLITTFFRFCRQAPFSIQLMPSRCFRLRLRKVR